MTKTDRANGSVERLGDQAADRRALGTIALARSYVALGKLLGGGWLSF